MALLSLFLRIPIHGKTSALPSQKTPHEFIHHFKLFRSTSAVDRVLFILLDE